MKVIVFSKSNLFSSNILSLMLSKNLLKLSKTNKINPKEIYNVYIDNKLIKDIKAIEVDNFLYLTAKDITNIEKEFNETCEFIIISSHKSKTKQIDTISIHFCGNFNKNEFGGEENNFSVANLDAFEYLYHKISLDKNKPKGLNFFVEATHHGPTINKPLLFYEIGPNDVAYNNKIYQEYYLSKLLDYLKDNKKNNLQAYILIGAPHYLDVDLINSIKTRMNKKYNKKEFILSHIMPKYSLKKLLEEDDSKIEIVFSRLIDKAQTGNIIFYKRYLKSLTRLKDIVKKIEKKGINYFII